MIVLVSDTCILIDLERGGLLEAAFSCGFTMVVPDLIYDIELSDYNGPYLKSLGLGVVALTPQEVEAAQQARTQRPTLSLPDCFALSCAHRVDHALVSGDKNLRSEAKNRKLIVYGLLWLLDQMETFGISTSQLYEGLTLIENHRTCRLPKEEVKARLLKWKA